MRKDFFEEFCREFAMEMNRLRMEQRASVTSAKREGISTRIKKLLNLMLNGEIAVDEGKAEMKALDGRRKEPQIKRPAVPIASNHHILNSWFKSRVPVQVRARPTKSRRMVSNVLRSLLPPRDASLVSPEGRCSPSGRTFDMGSAACATNPDSRCWLS